MTDRPLCLFALHASAKLGAAVAAALARPLAAHEEREFEDGEHKTRPLEAVRGADVFVLQGLNGETDQSANDKLCRLLFFIGALKDAGAERVTALTPYLCYSRKDRRTKPQDPVSTRYVAACFEAVGADCVVTLDVHNPAAFENAFRRPTVALTAAPLFVDYVQKNLGEEPLCVVSPDPGGTKRADIFHEALEAALRRPLGKAFVEKRRSAGVVSGELFVGEADGVTALIIDDLISTGGTLVRAARAARGAGATRVLALVTHGLFMPGADAALVDPALDRIVVTDSVAAFRLHDAAAKAKLDTLPVAPLLAEAIRRMHAGETLTDLLVF
jgi:ribose-phosphate pyrophosphokinase